MRYDFIFSRVLEFIWFFLANQLMRVVVIFSSIYFAPMIAKENVTHFTVFVSAYNLLYALSQGVIYSAMIRYMVYKNTPNVTRGLLFVLNVTLGVLVLMSVPLYFFDEFGALLLVFSALFFRNLYCASWEVIKQNYRFVAITNFVALSVVLVFASLWGLMSSTSLLSAFVFGEMIVFLIYCAGGRHPILEGYECLADFWMASKDYLFPALMNYAIPALTLFILNNLLTSRGYHEESLALLLVVQLSAASQFLLSVLVKMRLNEALGIGPGHYFRQSIQFFFIATISFIVVLAVMLLLGRHYQPYVIVCAFFIAIFMALSSPVANYLCASGQQKVGNFFNCCWLLVLVVLMLVFLGFTGVVYAYVISYAVMYVIQIVWVAYDS
ncbi:hypothetical protein [Jeongeupia sp. USM3]|uniref:hypothetical protein n=1 Tax=Jeongeupia sp. USM3 TaxID=1906741 RepID=UPI0011AB6FF8|nr:hypothetical protein [Jeongeupia sp. USM3]